MASSHSPVLYQPWFTIPFPSSVSLYPAHPSQWKCFFILASSSWFPSPLTRPLCLLPVGAILLAQTQPFTPLLPWHWNSVTAPGDPRGERKGLSQQGAHHPTLASAASGSQWAFIGFPNCICLLTAFACLPSSLLVLTHIENEGVNTLTWVITLRLLFFFLGFPSSSPKNKGMDSKGIK